MTSVNGEYVAKLEGRKPKAETRIKITSDEKKPNYGAKIAKFGIEYYYSKTTNLFMVINKIRGKGKYQPVFKTEV